MAGTHLAQAHTCSWIASVMILSAHEDDSGQAHAPSVNLLHHAGTGLVYMQCWPLYSAQPWARWLCASVPAAATLHYLLVGLRVTSSSITVQGSTVGLSTAIYLMAIAMGLA